MPVENVRLIMWLIGVAISCIVYFIILVDILFTSGLFLGLILEAASFIFEGVVGGHIET